MCLAELEQSDWYRLVRTQGPIRVEFPGHGLAQYGHLRQFCAITLTQDYPPPRHLEQASMNETDKTLVGQEIEGSLALNEQNGNRCSTCGGFISRAYRTDKGSR